MSFLTTLPGDMESATAGLAGIGTMVAAANAGATPAISGVVPPAPEPASVLLAAAFQIHSGLYQVTQALGTAMHEMFVATMGTSAASYSASEVANMATML